MSLIALGINHNTAPVEIREQLSFSEQELGRVLRELSALPGVQEVAVLSTCNRTEIYGSLDEQGGQALVDWLTQRQQHNDQDNDLHQALYQFSDADAVRHAMSVACGLDSMVLGEPQILGQMKQAYEAALEAGTAQRTLHQLFQGSFSVAKQVRTDTGIGQNPVSVAYAAVDLARQIFADFEKHTALLIGAGDTIELAAQHLARRGIGRMIIANRNPERARLLAAGFKGYGIGLEEIPAHLAEADIIIASTASREPILTRPMVKEGFRKRRHKPVLMVDIAVPRDIEADVAELPDVFLYTIDDLQETIRENLASREQAAARGLEIIEARAHHLAAALNSMDAVPAIRTLRDEATAQRDRTLAQAKRMLAAGRASEDVLDYMAHTLTNRLLHQPTVQLREAAERGERETLAVARELFGLDNDGKDEE
ncbi:glutamyl-tRNA reductase [Natronospira proteinivora]|uniref:Glutamyl-tRNA reductase n=1 Tax=Natronospira proteinivora TaxID=1807133 RepID=A0ABT1G8I1_9GAMM|nr:glutamyl-tRNA reductase [Natronospira proteinivora]MCP1727362.1 glutamyl-tRNA reductase [Natronospira proteinivora]